MVITASLIVASLFGEKTVLKDIVVFTVSLEAIMRVSLTKSKLSKK